MENNTKLERYSNPGKKTHGETRTRLHRIWRGLRFRCYNSTHAQFKDYGGRGISVCEEWERAYEPFRDWALSNGYSSDLTIDRINVNGNYEPSNCRWATQEEQSNNKSDTILIEINGISKSLTQWARELGINPKTAWYRVSCGYPPDFAVLAPLGSPKKGLKRLYEEFVKNKTT